MRTMSLTQVKVGISAVFAVLLACAWPLLAATDTWQREDVDWQAGGGRRIKGIYYPQGKPVPTRAKPQAGVKPGTREGFRVAAGPEQVSLRESGVSGIIT
jgi:hypothetical protein